MPEHTQTETPEYRDEVAELDFLYLLKDLCREMNNLKL